MTDAQGGRVVVCRVGSRRFTVPIAAISAVVVTPTVVRIPGAPPAIRGVVNVRGGLITVVSGPVLLNVPDAEDCACLLVLAMHDGRVGIEVDDVEDLHTTSSASGLTALDVDLLIRPLLQAAATKA